MPVVIDADQSSSFGSEQIINLFYDSWGGATPTYVLIDHTMTVRAKPFPLDGNGNPSGCDVDSMDGWSGGSTDSFIAQLVEECGDLCLGCSDCDEDGIEDNVDNCPHCGKKLRTSLLAKLLIVVLLFIIIPFIVIFPVS